METPTTGIASGDLSAVTDGLFQISPGGTTPDFDVVFVHGLEGHPQNTWTRESRPRQSQKRWWRRFFRKRRASHATSDSPNATTTECFWPRDLLAEDFPKARIFTFGYDSAITHFFRESAYQGSILDHSTSLLQRLSAERRDCLKRPLIFIAHSLGGLVVKSAMRESENGRGATASWKHVSASTIAVLFFGTPHRGSDWTDTAMGLERMVNFLGPSTTSNNLNALTRNNVLARVLSDDFLRQLERGHFHVTSYQEQKGCSGLANLDTLIVDADSSKIGHRFEKTLPISADHRNMCKFDVGGQSRRTYNQFIKCEISEHLNRASEIQRHEDAIARIRSGSSGQPRDIAEPEDMPMFDLQLAEFYETMNARAHDIGNAHEQTLSWLLSPEAAGPRLQDWLSTGTGIYWIQGSPGSGKSTVMKTLVHSQRIAPRVLSILGESGWSYGSMFPTDRTDEDHRSFKTVLAAMVHRLWKHNPGLSSIIEPLVTRDIGGDLLSQETLKDVLLRCKRQREVPFSMCFFIDAIDEIEPAAESRVGMIQFMKDLVANDIHGSGRFKLCVASRPENEIERGFRDSHGFCLQDLTGDDIRNFVRARLDHHHLSDETTHNAVTFNQTLEHIREDIIGAAQGVFLWVRVVINHVLSRHTRGEALSEIHDGIHDFQHDDLSKCFLRILEKTPRDSRQLTNALFQVLLVSREPPSILTVGVLLDLISKQTQPQGRHSISDEKMSELSDSRRIGRRISDLTGGLVQVIPDLSGSNQQETLGSRQKVRFLHQSVRDFLQAPESKSTLEEIGLLSSTDTADPMCNGNILMLCAVDAYLGLSPNQQARWAMNAMEVTIHHAPATESSFADSSFELLLRVSRDLSVKRDRDWGMGTLAWNTTFLAFAVAHKMHTFVRKCLDERVFKVRKKGRPLLHYAAWSPGCYPDVTMAEILVKAGASLHKTYKDPAHHGARTALETLNFKEMEQDGQSHVDFIKFFIEHGADVTRLIPYGDGSMLTTWLQRAPGIPRRIRAVSQRPSWSTVLHNIAEGPILGAQKMEILRQVPRSRLNDKRADGFTVFGLLLKNGMSGPTSITTDEAGELIRRGALITRRVVDMGPPTRELVKQHSQYVCYRHGAWRRRKTLMKDGKLEEWGLDCN